MLRVLRDLVQVAKDEHDNSSNIGSHCRELAVDVSIFIIVQLAFWWVRCSRMETCKYTAVLTLVQIFFAIGNATIWGAQLYLMHVISRSEDKDAGQDYQHVRCQLAKNVIKATVLLLLHYFLGIVAPLVCSLIIAVKSLPLVQDHDHALWYKYVMPPKEASLDHGEDYKSIGRGSLDLCR
eukprot:TRINITY_DN19296_c0_g1_i2.p1 TRINITY_DN19296_c0_g1~~TRINITY_DN19296_c0_g1_i2.p1  ORF type:complete len:180 (-),score=32.88 TRINITY_DN19296_c0_g1_i2:89-628(-)